MTPELLIQWMLFVQAGAVLIACGSVLWMSITVWRSTASVEDRLTRIDSLLDHLEGGTNARKECE